MKQNSESYQGEISSDPFFFIHEDNLTGCPPKIACIGTQGCEYNYVYGYIDSAKILCKYLVESDDIAKFYTIVLPILYTARHAIELALKYVYHSLLRMSVIKEIKNNGHDIQAVGLFLKNTKIGDKSLRDLLNLLDPYVESLSRIDKDGQELRYYTKTDGKKSLPKSSTVNLNLVSESLENLSELIRDILYRVDCLKEERSTNSFTKECSRKDLEDIAKIIGNKKLLDENGLLEKKDEIIRCYGLSKRGFCRAYKKITESSELAALLGIKTAFIYLSEDDFVLLASKWKEIHRRECREFSESARSSEDFLLDIDTNSKIVNELKSKFSREKVAEIYCLYLVGSRDFYIEHLSEKIENELDNILADNDFYLKIDHLINKSNLLSCLEVALKKKAKKTLFKA